MCPTCSLTFNPRVFAENCGEGIYHPCPNYWLEMKTRELKLQALGASFTGPCIVPSSLNFQMNKQVPSVSTVTIAPGLQRERHTGLTLEDQVSGWTAPFGSASLFTVGHWG